MTKTGNEQVQAAWHYHRLTSHSLEKIQRDTYRLDWDNYPSPFKVYRNLPAEPLPTHWDTSRIPALEAILDDGSHWQREARLDRVALARLLFFSAGVVRVRQYGQTAIPYRAAACTGNLHHIDLYLVTGRLPDLDPGVYHFAAHDFTLRRLRRGDHRGHVVAATAAEPPFSRSPLFVICTSTFWRNAWKYRDRAYRHSFWDCGTILANLFAVATASHLRHELAVGFVDAAIHRLLAVDPRREAALAVVGLGFAEADPPAPPPLDPIAPEVEPVSRRELEFPEIQRMHAASALETPAQVRQWRSASFPTPTAPLPGARAPMRPLPELPPSPSEPIEAVILRRGSTRRFARVPLPASAFAAVVRAALARIPGDFQQRDPLTEPYLIVNAVEGLDPGSYVLQRRPPALVPLRHGSFRSVAGQLALGQALAADAAVNVYHLADLHRVLPAFGNRGYRAAQLEGGIAGGKIYLAAFALGVGATGLTFFDDDVTEFFSPHAAGKSVMFLTAVGIPYRKAVAP